MYVQSGPEADILMRTGGDVSREACIGLRYFEVVIS